MAENTNFIDKHAFLKTINEDIEDTYQFDDALEKINYPDNVLTDDQQRELVDVHEDALTRYSNLLDLRALVNQWPDEGLIGDMNDDKRQ